MNQGFWMTKDSGCVNDAETAYDNTSNAEPKRSHQWFIDGHEAELLPNKKQAIGVPTPGLFSGLINGNVSQWANAPPSHVISGHLSERLFNSETARGVNFDDQGISSVSSEKVKMERNGSGDVYDASGSSFGLSMSHPMENSISGINYEGIRKAKVSEGKESENQISLSTLPYDGLNANTMSRAQNFNNVDDTSTSVGLGYDKVHANIMSIDHTSSCENNIFLSVAQSSTKGDESVTLGQPFRETNYFSNFFSKGNNFTSLGQPFNGTGDHHHVSAGQPYSKANNSIVPVAHVHDNGESNKLTIIPSFIRGESTIISFGGCDDADTDPSGRLISGYDILMAQRAGQNSDSLNEKELISLTTDALVSSGNLAAVGSEVFRKKEDAKASKKTPPNNFPSNVRSLLSTGMLDGVPVKYIAWSREKELHGVIKASGYQCGCQLCNFSKVINAYEFERHAGCKTKHPNNHIYFENGKTIYGIVQELRSTPQHMLFDVIQNITGSPINQKSFKIWKDSFLAATRELQRIYGKDDNNQLS